MKNGTFSLIKKKNTQATIVRRGFIIEIFVKINNIGISMMGLPNIGAQLQSFIAIQKYPANWTGEFSIVRQIRQIESKQLPPTPTNSQKWFAISNAAGAGHPYSRSIRTTYNQVTTLSVGRPSWNFISVPTIGDFKYALAINCKFIQEFHPFFTKKTFTVTI